MTFLDEELAKMDNVLGRLKDANRALRPKEVPRLVRGASDCRECSMHVAPGSCPIADRCPEEE